MKKIVLVLALVLNSMALARPSDADSGDYGSGLSDEDRGPDPFPDKSSLAASSVPHLSTDDYWDPETDYDEETSSSPTATTTASNPTTTGYGSYGFEQTTNNFQFGRNYVHSGSTAASKQGLVGNLAKFNQSCGEAETEPRCDPLTMVCSRATSRCECKIPDCYLFLPDCQCLPIGHAPGDECMFDLQCTEGLGHYSRCFNDQCQCADVVEQRGEAVFYKGTCYAKRALGDTCENELQCKASIHENAVCALHPSYLENEKVCHCPEGVECYDKGGAAVPLSGGLLFVMAAHLLLMSFSAFTAL